MRSRIQGSDNFGPVQSFILSEDRGIRYSDSVSFAETQFDRISRSGGSIQLDSLQIHFSVESAGASDGSYAIIAKDNQNLVAFSQLKGHHVCVFNSVDLEFLGYQRFKLNDGPAVVQAYMDLLDSLTNDKIVMIAVANEGTQGLSSQLKDKIRTIGSIYIDSLSFGGSWAVIGYKGAPPGSVLEGFSDPLDGPVVLDTTYTRSSKKGYLTTAALGPAGRWDFIELDYDLPDNSILNVFPVGISGPGIYDTLEAVPISNGLGSLAILNQNNYNNAKFLFEFLASGNVVSPELNSAFIKYHTAPELSINYQVVGLSADSVDQGDPIDITYSIYNVGEVEADSFYVLLNLIKSDNSVKKLSDTLISRIDSMSSLNFSTTYSTNNVDGYGEMAFEILVDTSNSVTELYEDNNFYRMPFYVIKDTITSVNSADVNVTFDGLDIYEGDFISPNPNIDIVLDYQPEFPYGDTNSVKIYMDGKRIFRSKLDSVNYDTASRRVTYRYSPTLEDGEHYLRIDGENLIGNIEEASGYEKMFLVSSEAQILYVYNYPNPFSSDTYFTFKLTQVPDEVEFKIYTVAGRLVKEFNKRGDELNIDFNRIYWDGRDMDGDLLANGTYLYKIIMKSAEKIKTVTQKFAIVR
jgi:hypothetical protein